jgi:hypothetical protein
VVIYGGDPYWIDGPEDFEYDRLPKPKHQKFLGDGALYIWTGTQREPPSNAFILKLCNRLRDLRKNFGVVAAAARERVQITGIPREIRFGLAVGDVHELTRRDARHREYVGVCINLASRLQKYCDDIGFAAARATISPSARETHGYVRVIANNIDGFPSEYVILDRVEYESMDPEARAAVFRPVK